MMMKQIVLSLFGLLFTLQIQAQYKISGTVSDAAGRPLAGATVTVKELPELGSVTDTEGHYEIAIPGKGSYTFCASFVGYESASEKVAVGQSDKLNFRLVERSTLLNQVVVTATRTPKLLKDVPIVTRVISEADIKQVDATHIGDLLQSELPGIEFSYSMNQQVSLNMSGFGGNSVLFLVDGERLAGETLDNVDYSRMNMDNVGSIEIV